MRLYQIKYLYSCTLPPSPSSQPYSENLQYKINEMGNIKLPVSVSKYILYHHNLKQALMKYIKVKQSHYMPGVAQRVPGS
jgi:hypothetical protein